MLAVGTGESQLHAATEHIAHALGASSVSVLAVLSDPDAAYLVADSDESRGRPHAACRSSSTRTCGARSRPAR